MPFPQAQRSIYKHNPLVKVICQLRYPKILRISAEPPVEFQDMIISQYPILQEKQDPDLPNIPQEVASLFQIFNQSSSTTKSWNFLSEDEKWTIGLNDSFLSLDTDNYVRWEDFKRHVERPFEALTKIYSPPFFTRIGLRYINLIDRSLLELPKKPTWSELLKPQVLGALSSQEIEEDSVREHEGQTLIQLKDDIGYVRVRFGFQELNDSIGFRIDNDFFYAEKVGVENALERLELLNRKSTDLFRWFIRDELHYALQPSTP